MHLCLYSTETQADYFSLDTLYLCWCLLLQVSTDRSTNTNKLVAPTGLLIFQQHEQKPFNK